MHRLSIVSITTNSTMERLEISLNEIADIRFITEKQIRNQKKNIMKIKNMWEEFENKGSDH